MTDLDIESVLNYQLEQYRIVHPIDVAFSGGPEYKPVEGTNFLSIDLLPAGTESVNIGATAKNRSVGIYQITINTASLNGRYVTNTIANQLQEFFKRGTGIINNGVKVRITKFRINRFDEDSVWGNCVIDVTYRSDIDN